MVAADMTTTRIIGLDVGDKRIGVAVSDLSRLIATPLTTIARKNMKADVRCLQELIREQGVGEIVIGLPMNMDDSEGTQAVRTRALAKQLGRASGLKVHFEDERLSTFTAVEILVQRGIKTGHNRDLVDMEAAAIILQSFLDRQRGSG